MMERLTGNLGQWATITSLLLFGTATAGFAEPPGIVPLSIGPAWQRADFRIDHAPAATNCFDPDEIRIDAVIQSPSGKSSVVPAFWYQDFSRGLSNGVEVVAAVHPPEWRVRFTPTEPGKYSMGLRVTVAGRAVPASAPAAFEVAASTNAPRAGYVRVGPDRRYFETADGQPLRLIGENICWSDIGGTHDFDRWMSRMSAAGENFGRVWLAPWFLGLEHKPATLNRYDLAAAWQLDYIFDLASREGIYLLLCLDHHGMYQTDNKNWGGSNNFWKSNPYSSINGGPCARPNDFFTDAAARKIYQKRLRYLVARYGWSPELLAWQFFNEIDNVYGPLRGDDVLAWHREMGQWLRTNDPYHHLVTTSLTGGSERPEIWSLPEMDFSMYHSYGEPAPGSGAARLGRDFVSHYGKPAMIGEFGIDARSWNIASDPHLRGFRQALWGGALGGSVGTAMSWWWQNMDSDDVYPLFAAMHRILQTAGWNQGAWTPADFETPGNMPVTLDATAAAGDPFQALLPLNASWRLIEKLPNRVALASPIVSERASEFLSGYLLGNSHPEMRKPLEIQACFGDKATLAVHIGSIASNVDIAIRVDGKRLMHKSWPTSPGVSGARPKIIDEDVTAEIPAGVHRVSILNEGDDWALASRVRIDSAREIPFAGDWQFAPEQFGLRGTNTAVVYLYSPWIVFPAGALRFNPPVQTGQSITLLHWPAGAYEVRWFDPSSATAMGTARAESRDGKLRLPLPAYREDLAGMVVPAP
ncbi:MAG: DUF5060 domain-containing protein [Verrucomicrobiota bacterium]